MKTYHVIYAQEVSLYAYVPIQAADDDAAILAARGVDRSTAAFRRRDDSNPFCERIVEIADAQGNVVADDIRLDNCFVCHGDEHDERLHEDARALLSALEAVLEQLAIWIDFSEPTGTETDAAADEARALIAKHRRPR